MKKLLFILFLFVGVESISQTPMYKLLRGKKTLLYDTFTDANGTTLASHGMNIGGGWTASPNGLNCGAIIQSTVQSNHAQPGGGFYSISTANAGVANCIASIDALVPNASNYVGGLVFRYSDCANYWFLTIQRASGGTPYMQIVEVQGGVETSRASVNVPGATNTTLNIKVTLNGNSIVALAGTGETTNYTSSFNNTATKFGIWGYDDSGSYSPAVPFDNFLVTN